MGENAHLCTTFALTLAHLIDVSPAEAALFAYFLTKSTPFFACKKLGNKLTPPIQWSRIRRFLC